MIDIGVVHGRFQIFHLDHLAYVAAAGDECRHLVVGITNPDPSLTRPDPAAPHRSDPQANPLTYFERYTMVRAVLRETNRPEHSFSVVPLPINIPELFRHYVPLEATFFLTIYDDWGRSKLKRFQSLGLKTRVLWDDRPKVLTSTEIRRKMIQGLPWEAMVPPATARLMNQWNIPGRLAEPGH